MKRTLPFAILLALIMQTQAFAATSITDNFTATHRDTAFAHQVTAAAEKARIDYAVLWLGKELPRWNERCPITVKVGQIGAGGSTTFSFDRGSVFGWRMRVQGSSSAILNDVVPHEVTHTIMASHFRRPLPRWADEGMATMSETQKEYNDQWAALRQTWNTAPMSFREMLTIKEYPRNMNRVMSMYARGFHLTAMLVEKRGRAKFLEFLRTANVMGWEVAVHGHYQYDSIEQMEQDWRGWVAQKPVIREQSSSSRRAASQVVLDPTLSITDGRGNGISIRSPIALAVGATPECRIEMLSASWCDPCIAWKRTELPKVRAAGIHVDVIKDDARARAAGVKSYPTFIIIHANREQARRPGFGRATRTTAADLVALFRSTHPKAAPANNEWKPESVAPPPAEDVAATVDLKAHSRLDEFIKQAAVDRKQQEANFKSMQGNVLSLGSNIDGLTQSATKDRTVAEERFAGLANRLTVATKGLAGESVPQPGTTGSVIAFLGTAAGLSATAATGLGVGVPIAIALYRRRKKRKSGESPVVFPVTIDSPPEVKIQTETHYVPVASNEFQRATKYAHEQLVHKYPGALGTVEFIDSVVEQFLHGSLNAKGDS